MEKQILGLVLSPKPDLVQEHIVGKSIQKHINNSNKVYHLYIIYNCI